MMTVAQLINQFRQLVIEHPEASNVPVVLQPHGGRRDQPVGHVELNFTGTKVFIESERD